jgi:hypothetical protein
MKDSPLTRVLILIVTLAFASDVSAQTIGPSLELYPAGAIVTARYSRDVSTNARIHIHAGMNATDRRDWGKHALERGAGFGVGLAGHRYRGDVRTGPWVGARLDVWAMTIEWEDPGRAGETTMTVLQPTARLGWTFPAVGKEFDLSASLGMEMNLNTTGEGVGEGAIFLLGIAVAL